MGSQKESGTTVVNQTTTPKPTEEETELNKLLLERTRATQAGTIQSQQSGLNLVNQLLTGQIPSGDIYQQISGISPQAIGTQATRLASQNMAGYNQLGLGDSGVALAGISRSIANELLYPAEQYNIGARQNLLNLALTGQAQVQAPMQAGTNTLASNLQGLRSVNTQGTSTTTQSSNPFMKSFMTSLGSTLGSPQFAAGPFTFGGR